MGFEIFKASYIKRLFLARFLWVSEKHIRRASHLRFGWNTRSKESRVGGCGGSGALEIGETVQHAAESVLVEIDI